MAVRRICKADCCQEFLTGEARFDFDANGNSIPLTYYLQRDESGQYESYVYEEEGEIVGVLCIEITANRLYLSRIGIKEKYRKLNRGYYLHKFMMDLVEQRKVKMIVALAHDGVFSWFKKLGYLPIHEYNDPLWGKSAIMSLLIG